MLQRAFIATLVAVFLGGAFLFFPARSWAQAGPVAAYSFNEGVGTTVADVSGNNSTGTISGATWATAGQFGSALVFNGSSSFVNLGNPATLRLTGSMTISAWVRSAAFPVDDAAIVSKRTGASLGYQLDTTIDTGPRTIGFKLTNASGGDMIRYGATAMQLNQWYYVTGVYDAAAQTLNVYLNGQLNNGTLLGTVTSTQRNSSLNVNVGRRPGLSGYAFNGTIDEVRIYNRALTQAEIQTDMSTPVGGTPPPSDTTVPTAPAGLTATAASATQINLAWTAATDNVGVTGYRVERCAGAGCTTFTQVGTPTGPSLNDTGLTATTSYSYRVRAVDAAGNLSTYSNIDSATTPAAPDTTAPTAPTGLTATAASPSQINLSWTASTDNVGVTLYWIDRCQGSGCTTFVQIATSTTTSFSDIGLAAATTYRYRVRASDAAGNVGANSSVASATTPAVPDTTRPTAPGGLTAMAVSPSQINLAWIASTDDVGVTGYLVEHCQGAGCGTWVQIGTVTGTTFNDTGLAAATTYRYWVRATDAAGNLSPWSSIVAATTLAPDTSAPTAPGGLTAAAAGSTQVNLAWGAASDDVGVTGYRVERCAGAGCTTFAEVATAAGLGFSDAAVAPGTSYSYRVRAVDAAGNLGGYSNVASATTSNTPAGLVAAYAFNEGSGTTVADVSGNVNTGTISGATWTTAGRFGNALAFNGTSNVVTIPNSASLQLTTGMTLQAWVFPTATPSGWRAVIAKNVDRYYLMAGTDQGDRPAAGGTWVAGNQNTFGPTVLAVNVWTHLAATFDGATVRLYINGTQVASQAQTTTLVSTNGTLQIGGDAYPNEFFAGRIDEVRIYNRALTQAEIQADMAAPVDGALPPADTTPPSVALISPLAGATVSSTITVSASASDNVGVSNVQFLLDGAALGATVPTPPYAISWNTAGVTAGPHVLQARATDSSGNATTSDPVSVTVAATSPATVGQWATPVTWPIVAVHSNLLSTGEVLAWEGENFSNDARLWNPVTGVFTSVPNNLTKLFCTGHSQLADGRLLVAGGHLGTHVGLRDTNIFNSATRTWTRVAPMAVGRWYPTATTLPDGRVLVTSGEIDCAGCFAPIPEIYDPQTDVWTQLTGASQMFPYYPHMFVLPDGRVLAASTSEDMIVSRVLDIGTQTWSVVDPNPVDGGSAVMYAPGKVMKSGRSSDPQQTPIPSVATTYVLDMNQATPRWRETPPMRFARAYHTLTLLPDGTVLATGGGPTTNSTDVANAVLAAELWSPVTETWTVMTSMRRPRLYHSNALLMPDARVLIAGGGRTSDFNESWDQFSSEFYSPPYLFKGARPAISSAPSIAAYGGNIAVQSPDAARIASVSLVKLGSVTHAFNQDQRILQSPFTVSGSTLNVQAPANANLAPPGYYMLFILDTNGVPSVAAILKLQ